MNNSRLRTQAVTSNEKRKLKTLFLEVIYWTLLVVIISIIISPDPCVCLIIELVLCQQLIHHWHQHCNPLDELRPVLIYKLGFCKMTALMTYYLVFSKLLKVSSIFMYKVDLWWSIYTYVSGMDQFAENKELDQMTNLLRRSVYSGGLSMTNIKCFKGWYGIFIFAILGTLLNRLFSVASLPRKVRFGSQFLSAE